MAHATRFDAVVLRTVDVGEADRLCILFTREAGKKAARARGVRKLRSRLKGVLLPLKHVTVELHERDGRALVVGAVECGDCAPPPHSFPHFASLQQAIELLLVLTEENEPLPGVFSLLLQMIALSSVGKPPLLPFQLRLLALLGLLPASRDDARFARLPPAAQTFVALCAKEDDLRILQDSQPPGGALPDFLHFLLADHLRSPLKSEGMGVEMR